MRLFDGWRRVLGALVIALGAASFAAAQEEGGEPGAGGGEEAKPEAPATAVSDADPEQLKGIWSDILAKALAGEEDAVRDQLTKMTMQEDDFIATFGDKKGPEIAARYKAKFAEHWPNEAKNILRKVKEKQSDEVEVYEITADTVAPEDKTLEEKKRLLPLLKPGTKMYCVKIKKKGEKTGLRYDCLFFANGQWKAGLMVWKLLADEKKPEKEKK